MNLRGSDWVIVGGESGPGARPMSESWVTDIRDQCQRAGVAFYFKQWGNDGFDLGTGERSAVNVLDAAEIADTGDTGVAASVL